MKLQTGDALIRGDSPAIRQVRALISKVGPTSLPVLIQGETGVGKELVAQALHAASRRTGAFVAFNVCAVAEPMFEDALFGHVRGAFTGATNDAPGYLAEANGGTVFLDEVGGLPVAQQMKLLRVLETRVFRAVGARSDRTSDFRVVAATNEDLDGAARQQRYRADLTHRLSGVVIEVPPLRSRIDDVPLLAEHFLERCLASLPQARQFSDDALAALCDHDWPGNVRELKHVVERAAALAPGPVITGADIRAVMRTRPRPALASRAAAVEPELLAELERTGGDIAAAARQLGVHRTTVYRRLWRAGLRQPCAPLPAPCAPDVASRAG